MSHMKEYAAKIMRPPHECPKCGAGSKVTQSKAGATRTHKRRLCKCGEMWSTVEITQDYYHTLLKAFGFMNDVFSEVDDVG